MTVNISDRSVETEEGKKAGKMREKRERRPGWDGMLGAIADKGMETEPGIDGILVTVGLCIIALLLCVVMKDSLQTFIETLVTAMTTEAQKILTGVSG